MILFQIRSVFRALLKQKGFTGIHIVGLSLGLTCCLLVYLFIQHERSFDNYHLKGDRIYRVTTVTQTQNGVNYSVGTPYPMAPALRTDITDFEKVARIHNQDDGVIGDGKEKRLQFDDILFADPEFFDLFDFEIIEGGLQEAMREPNQVVLTQASALKIFGEATAIGKTINLDNQLEAKVAGVIKDPPHNTHLPVSMFFSMESLSNELVGGFDYDSWGTTIGNITYALLPGNAQPDQFKEPLRQFVEKHMTDEASDVTNTIELQPLSDIHFNTNYSRGQVQVVPIPEFYLWVFGLIGGLILLIACFNFINLSTAQAMQRGKEVGVRKVLGAGWSSLVGQFMAEGFLISLLSGILALIFSFFALPWVNELLDKQLPANQLLTLPTIAFLLLVVFLVGAICGIYPALGLARFHPVQILGSKNTAGNRNSLNLRRTLVVSQFIITLGLIIASLTIARQVKFMKNKDLGFDQTAMLMTYMPEQDHYDQIRSELLRENSISSVSFCIGAPTSVNNIGTSFSPKGEDANQITYENDLKAVDFHYQETFGLELIAGRWFRESEAPTADLRLPEEEQHFKLVVNETLSSTIGYSNPEDLVGKNLVLGVNSIEAEVIGVVNDFNTTSLENAVKPTILMHIPHLYFHAGLKINAQDVESAIAHLETIWSKQFPDSLFDYWFLDERIEKNVSK